MLVMAMIHGEDADALISCFDCDDSLLPTPCCCNVPSFIPSLCRFHVRDAVKVAGAKRIGHGVAIQWEEDSKGTLKYMANNKVTLAAHASWIDRRLGALSLYLSRACCCESSQPWMQVLC